MSPQDIIDSFLFAIPVLKNHIECIVNHQRYQLYMTGSELVNFNALNNQLNLHIPVKSEEKKVPGKRKFLVTFN